MYAYSSRSKECFLKECFFKSRTLKVCKWNRYVVSIQEARVGSIPEVDCLSLACKCTSMRVGGGGLYRSWNFRNSPGISHAFQEFFTQSRNFSGISGISQTFQTYCTILKRKFSLRNYMNSTRAFRKRFLAFREICIHSWNLTRIQRNLQKHLGNLANSTFSPDTSRWT